MVNSRGNQETPSPGQDGETSAKVIDDTAVKQRPWRIELEGRGRPDLDGDDFMVGCQVIDFIAWPRPLRVRATSLGNLPLTRGVGYWQKGLDVYFPFARFIRAVYEPLSIRGEFCVPFVVFGSYQGDRGSIAEQRECPYVTTALRSDFVVKEETAIRRPVRGELPAARSEKQFLIPFAAGQPLVQIESALLVCGKSNVAAVG